LKNKPDIKILKQFLDLGIKAQKDLADEFDVHTNTARQWLSRGKLPRNYRKFILSFISTYKGKKS